MTTAAQQAEITKLLRSPQGQQMLRDAEREEGERRTAKVREIEAEIGRLERHHATFTGTLNARIDVLTPEVEEARLVYREKERRQADLKHQRMQESLAHDSIMAELKTKLEGIQSGEEVTVDV